MTKPVTLQALSDAFKGDMPVFVNGRPLKIRRLSVIMHRCGKRTLELELYKNTLSLEVIAEIPASDEVELTELPLTVEST